MGWVGSGHTKWTHGTLVFLRRYVLGTEPDLQNTLRFIIRFIQDRLMIVTYNVLRFLLGISYAKVSDDPTILQVNRT